MKLFCKIFYWFMSGLGVAIVLAACSGATPSSSSSSAQSSAIAQASPSATPLPASVWEIQWQACDVINPERVSQRGCLPDMVATANRPPAKIVLWADQIRTPDDIHIETTNSQVGGVRARLFVRSKGCLNNAPGAEDFYYTGVSAQVKGTWAETPLPQAQWTVTPQQLSSEEASSIVNVVQNPISGRRFQMMGSTGVCLPLAQWKQQYGS